MGQNGHFGSPLAPQGAVEARFLRLSLPKSISRWVNRPNSFRINKSLGSAAVLFKLVLILKDLLASIVVFSKSIGLPGPTADPGRGPRRSLNSLIER